MPAALVIILLFLVMTMILAAERSMLPAAKVFADKQDRTARIQTLVVYKFRRLIPIPPPRHFKPTSPRTIAPTRHQKELVTIGAK